MKNKTRLLILFLLMAAAGPFPVQGKTGKTVQTSSPSSTGSNPDLQNHDPAKNTWGITYNLSGQLNDIRNKELIIVFSDDMVALGGKREGKKIVHIKPAVKGEFLWRGTKTLVFKPKTRFAFSTRYQVTVKKTTASLEGKMPDQDITWEFITPLAYPHQYWLSSHKQPTYFGFPQADAWIKDNIYLKFQQPVSARDFHEKLILSELNNSRPLTPLAVKCTPRGNFVIEIRFRKPLKRQTNYILMIRPGFKGAEGNCGTDREFSFTFHTAAPFEYNGKEDIQIPQDERQQFDFEFTNPLKDPEKAHIAVIKKMGTGAGSIPVEDISFFQAGKVLILKIYEPLVSGDELTIRLKKEITNLYGENLDHDVQLGLRVCSPLPAVYVEPHSAGLDLYVKNIQQLPITVCKFKDSLLDLLEKKPLEEVIRLHSRDEEYIAFKEIKTISRDPQGASYYSMEFPRESRLEPGCLGAVINSPGSFNRCQDSNITNFAHSFPRELAILQKNDIDFILRYGEKALLLWVYNNKTGQPVSRAEIKISRKEQMIKIASTNEEGVWQSELGLKPGDIITVKDLQSRQRVFYKISPGDLYSRNDDEKRKIVVELFTDRFLYQPGSTIYIGGIMKEFKNGKYQNPGIKEAAISIKERYGEIVKKDKVQPDEWGGFSYIFTTDKKIKKGEYLVSVDCGESDIENYETEIKIDHYQADAMKIQVTGFKETYSKNDLLEVLIKGYYLSGNPMSGDRLEYRLTAEEIFYDTSFNVNADFSDYSFLLDEDLREEPETDNTIEVSQTFDKEGIHRAKIDLREFNNLDYLVDLLFSVTAESAEGKEVSTTQTVFYLPGHRVIGLKLPYYNTVNKPIRAELAVIDPDGKLSEAGAAITIFKYNPYYDGNDEKPGEIFKGNSYDNWEPIKEFKNLTFKGKDFFPFTLEEPGNYIMKCDASDTDGDIIATSRAFYVSGPGEERIGEFEIDTDKEMYSVGENISMTVHSSHSQRGKALITVEQGRILDIFVVDLEANAASYFTWPVKEDYFPTVKFQVTAIFPNNRVETDYIELEIPGDRKLLEVTLGPAAKEIEPSTASRLKVKVADCQGKGRKAKLFVYAVNEGNLQLSQDYRGPGLFLDFYTSRMRDFFYDMNTIFSKTARVFDFLGWPQLGLPPKMECIITGRVTDQQDRPLAGVRVIVQECFYSYHHRDGHEKDLLGQTITNEDGYFLLARIPQRYCCDITFKKQGYRTYNESSHPIANTGFDKIDIRLQEEIEKSPAAQTPKVKTPKPLKKPGKYGISGSIKLSDGSLIPGVLVTLTRTGKKKGQPRTTISNEKGHYSFNSVPKGTYDLKFELEGFKTDIRKDVKPGKPTVIIDVFMEITTLKEEITVSARMEPGHYRKEDDKKGLADFKMSIEDWQSLLRKDFQEVLFFKVIETDSEGNAELEFKTSDLPTTYRVMAIAYSEDCFGSAETDILVSKSVYLEEALPEFARVDDQFTAGVQVSNRTTAELPVMVDARPGKMAILDKTRKSVSVPANGNRLVPFQFKAKQAGDSEIQFYALADSARDGLLKKLPVTHHLVSESVLDFDMGETLKKQVQPVKDALGPKLKIKVASSLLKPAGKIAEKLIFYPYECLEQRTSRVMPYLILDDTLMAQLEMNIDRLQVEEALQGYLEIIPGFMNREGGLSYYRGSPYVSDYLTIYVSWALRLAERKGFTVDTALIQELTGYLDKKSLTDVNESFYQYVLSMNRRGETRTLDALYEKREKLPVTARVFLYKALNNQVEDREKVNRMLTRMQGEFKNSLQVEADFAYFDAKEFSYDQEYPFYSSRYLTALILQALLEVEGKFPLAPRIINWLLEASPYMWYTTQTNTWILYAMAEYMKQEEKGGEGKVAVNVLEERVEKQLSSSRDVVILEKDIEKQKETFVVEVKADRTVYLTTELTYQVKGTQGINRGISVTRNVYDETGQPAKVFKKGGIYQVELLLEFDKEVPYGVIDEPLAAGFELLRQDLATTRELTEFNRENKKHYYHQYWCKAEHSPDRTCYYSYIYSGKIRVVYFIKALYPGTFTWLPTVVQGMYHPQYFGRTAAQQVTVHEE